MPRIVQLIALGGVLTGIIAVLYWTNRSETVLPSTLEPLNSAVAQAPAGDAKKEKFAQGREGNTPELKPIPFDGERAMKYLRQLCDIGPRISGSEGMKKQQKLVTEHFEKHGGKVTRQEFEAKQYSRKDKVQMTNLIVSYFPDRPRRVMLCAHYDTRPMAHEEPNRQAWNRPFLSANDGTSGVALLMELAHHMENFPTTFGVDFVLFDGEEYIFEPSGPFGGGDRFFIGSDYFADQYRANLNKTPNRYEAAILLDLFAHKGAVLRVEGNSYRMAPKLVEQVWQIAKHLGAKSFRWEQGSEVSDDHLALNRVGIPAIDIIDFDGYGDHWHRLSDTPDKCSPEQIAEVAKVLIAWLQWIR